MKPGMKPGRRETRFEPGALELRRFRAVTESIVRLFQENYHAAS